MKKRKQKITIEGLTIEGKTCDVTITFTDGLPSSITESLVTALSQSGTEVPAHEPTTEIQPLADVDSWTVFQKVRYITLRHCRHGWFTSKDIQELYERTFHPPLRLATASQYLKRMHDNGTLTRRGSAAQREYRVKIEDLTEEIAAILATKV
ncbi:MAG: hypothetical protein Q6364_07520 [Candidatus Hermodarchaeota archaeon]|nr:hypothetical protein [Candidatus Hermodarchaeota archaeon]